MIFLKVKTTVITLFCLLLHISCLFSQTSSVYLIGDAGEDKTPGKNLLLLKKYLEADSNSTVVFLGDNAYPEGVNSKVIDTGTKHPYLLKESANLYSQLTILKNYKGNVFFVPGNHDWKAQKKRHAFQSILNEMIICESYINDSTNIKNKSNNNFIINNGDEKNLPFYYDINDKLTLFLFDSQYYFQKIKGKKRKEKWSGFLSFLHSLDSLMGVKQKEGKKIIIASHHPLFTNGYHSKERQPLRFLINWTPLQIFGWLGLNRWLSQDIHQLHYKMYREEFLTVLKKYRGVIVAAGHDHNLQMINETDDIHIISGAGSKTKKFRRRKCFGMEFGEDKKEGFVKVEYDTENKMTVKFISEDNILLFSKTITD